MTIYLTIITTVLVLTQIIRLIQNYWQLKNMDKIEAKNEMLMLTMAKLHVALTLYLKERGEE